jgi:RNA polymerase sigma-70 factor (ECF subfamily)
MLYELQNDALCFAYPASAENETLTRVPDNRVVDSKISDHKLWSAFKNGDELAFKKIYQSFAAELLEYGCRYSTDKEMIRDCLHDFFLYLRKNRLGFCDTNCIKPYLFKAFRRRIIDYLKKSNSQLSLKEASDFSLFSDESSAESLYINKQVNAEQMERLSKALSSLDNKGRRAIYYFYFKGHSYEQIAELLKFSHVSSARRVMYRSLRRLRLSFPAHNGTGIN